MQKQFFCLHTLLLFKIRGFKKNHLRFTCSVVLSEFHQGGTKPEVQFQIQEEEGERNGFGGTSRCTYYLCTKTPLVVQFQIRCYEKEEERNGFWWNNNFFDSCPAAHTDLPACSLSENKSTKFFGEVSRHHLTTPPAPTPAGRDMQRGLFWFCCCLRLCCRLFFHCSNCCTEDWRCCPGFSIK